jgi:enamine deaminase RidA (YjgF/YER057c/UK114 family)
MATTFSNLAGVATPEGSCSHVARIDLENVALLFSGQVAQDPQGNLVGRGDAADQPQEIQQIPRHILDANGGTLSDIVKLTTFATDIEARGALVAIRWRDFPESKPASTLVAVSRLAVDDWLVEIEAVAAIDA